MTLPTPGPDEVLVRVRRVGLSAPDVIRLQVSPTPPSPTPGHEFAGEVAALGSAVHGWRVGDRVAVSRVLSCGRCAFCALGRETLCEARRDIGFDVDGALAETVVAPARNLYHLPDALDWSAAAVDPVASALAAVTPANIMFEDTVVVLGAGALGLYALQLARLAGPARLLAVGRQGNRLDVARRWADEVIDAAAVDGVAAVAGLTDGRGASVVIEATGDPAAVGAALHIAGRMGRVALLGLYPAAVLAPLGWLGQRGIDLYGTIGYTRKEFAQALSLIVGGAVTTDSIVTHTLPLTELAQGLDLAASRQAIKVHLEP